MLDKNTIYKLANTISDDIRSDISLKNNIKLNDINFYNDIVNQLNENPVILFTIELINNNIKLLKSIDSNTADFDLKSILSHVYVERNTYYVSCYDEDRNEKGVILKVLMELYEILAGLITLEKVLNENRGYYDIHTYITALFETVNVDGLDLDKAISNIKDKVIVKYNII